MATSSAKKITNSPKKSAAKSSRNKKKQIRKRKNRPNPTNPIVVPRSLAILCRFAIITVGISTLLGSAIAITNSWNNQTIPGNLKESASLSMAETKSSNLESLFSLVASGQEITPLTQNVQSLIQKYPQLKAGILIADLEKKSYVNLLATQTFSSASTIKIPILVAFFQDVDAHKIKLDELLTMRKDHVVDGSGSMQYEPVGKKFTARETATKMITISDNTATNMLIERLGGAKALNQRFADWGLNATKINKPLPDKGGTNTTSPENLSNLLLKIDRGELVSLASRDQILDIMKQTERNNLLPQGLDQGAKIAHKTGTLRSVLGDTGIIYLPDGQRYIASVLVKRPDDDPQAETLIQEISRTVYQYFQNQAKQSPKLPQKPSSFLTE